MPGLSRRRLEQLEDELFALGDETMMVEELDGFFAGLLVCPDLITPADWLPVIWSRHSDGQQPAFEDLTHANRVLELIMTQYNGVATTLMERPEGYRPRIPRDTRDDDMLWEIWIEGFEAAIALRPDAWQRLLDADHDTATAALGLLTLIEIARDGQSLSQSERDTVNATAANSISQWVVTLNEWWTANCKPRQIVTPSAPPHTKRKVGRNDPCPCGSGKKYKRCCGLD